MNADDPVLYRFGDCELDLRRHELRRHGERVEVQPKVLDCLCYLVRHRERNVGKDELQDEVWAGQVVTEAALTRAVMKARRAIDDDADSPQWIRTVHGRGYRFIGEVLEISEGEAPMPAQGDGVSASGGLADAQPAAPVATTASALAERLPSRRWRPIITVLVLLVLIVSGVLAWRVAAPSRLDATSIRIAVLPIENATGDSRLDWVGLGMMAQLAQHLERGAGRPVVPARDVLEALSSEPPGAGHGPAMLERIAERTRASHLIAARITQGTEGLQLAYELHDRRGRTSRRVLRGKSPSDLARGLLHDVEARISWAGRRPVADDDLVTETYLRALALRLEGRMSEAEPLFAQAVGSAPDTFWPRKEYGLVLRNLGRSSEAIEIVRPLLDHPLIGVDVTARSGLHGLLGTIHAQLGQFAEAEQRLRLAIDELECQEEPSLHAINLTNLGHIVLRLDRLDEAESLFAAATDCVVSAGTERVSGSILAARAEIAIRQERLADAETLLEQAIDADRLTGNLRAEGHAVRLFANLRKRQQRVDDARQHYLQAVALFESVNERERLAVTLLDLAALERDDANPSAARTYAVRARAQAEDMGDERLHGLAESLLGSLDTRAP